jgi:hypothetical protein
MIPWSLRECPRLQKIAPKAIRKEVQQIMGVLNSQLLAGFSDADCASPGVTTLRHAQRTHV